MRKLYVADTNSIISFFSKVFKDAPNYRSSPQLSQKANRIIEQAVSSDISEIRLTIPSIVFVEIYEKWLRTEEFSRKFFYNVFVPLRDSRNIEIRSNDRETLESFIKIDGILKHHDLHDKLILAAAMVLQATLITTDNKIINYVQQQRVIPQIIN